jgi:hypothetical protein
MSHKLLTRREAADLLRLSLDGIDTLSRRDDDPIPRMRAGRRWLYDTDALLAWACRQASRAPPRRWRNPARTRRKASVGA